MARSFDYVDDKLAEADFFLKKFSSCGANFFEARCYFSAFVAAARSVTFALQSVMSDIEGFSEWYAVEQERMKAEPVAKYFNSARRVTQHIGYNPMTGGGMRVNGDGVVEYRYFLNDLENEVGSPPRRDAGAAARLYLVLLFKLVLHVYEDFGTSVDPQKHYTSQHFSRMGKSIEDAEEEIIGIRGWTAGIPLEQRWSLLRREVPGCAIDDLFIEYAGVSPSG